MKHPIILLFRNTKIKIIMLERIKLDTKYLLSIFCIPIPVYKVDILRFAKMQHSHTTGLCSAICASLLELLGASYILPSYIKRIFPLFGENLKAFKGCRNSTFWWEPSQWDTGRMDYLDWLIEQYKDDRINLRKQNL